MEIRRDIYLNKLISKKHNGLIKVVTGMRRCGKSYLLFNLFKEYLVNEGVNENHIIEIAFDSFENRKYRDPEAFESVLNSLGRKKNVDVYVTGSNAKFLSKDIITKDAVIRSMIAI